MRFRSKFLFAVHKLYLCFVRLHTPFDILSVISMRSYVHGFVFRSYQLAKVVSRCRFWICASFQPAGGHTSSNGHSNDSWLMSVCSWCTRTWLHISHNQYLLRMPLFLESLVQWSEAYLRKYTPRSSPNGKDVSVWPECAEPNHAKGTMVVYQRLQTCWRTW